MGLSEQALDTLAATPPTPTELPFWEGAAASFEAGMLSEHSLSTEYQTGEALRTTLSAMREHGLASFDLGWPITDETANAALHWIDSQADEIKARRSLKEGVWMQTGEEIRAGIKERVGAAQAQAARAGTVASLAGGAGVALTDPLNLALLPLGAAAGEGLLMRALTEAGIGMASQAGVEVASLGAKERAGIEPTLSDAAGRVALVGGLGAGFAGVLHGAALVARRSAVLEAYRTARAEGTITGRTFDDAAAALEDVVETVRPQATPEAEAVFLDGVAAGGDVLQATTPEAAAMGLRRMSAAAAEVETPVVLTDARKAELGILDRAPRDTAIAAALDQPRPPAPEFVPTDPTPPARLTDETEEAAFVAATEANPDLPAHYTDAQGREHVGRASDLVAHIDDEITTSRSILDCVFAGGPKEIEP